MPRLFHKSTISIMFLLSAAFDFVQFAIADDGKNYLDEMDSRLRSLELTSTQAAPGPSRWNQNGSVVYLIADGAIRRLYYEIPLSELAAAGVKKGTLFFDGKKNGNHYIGRAYTFAAKCKPMGFPVNGDISDDEKQVTLRGKVPKLNSSCKVARYSDEALVLNFVPNDGN